MIKIGCVKLSKNTVQGKLCLYYCLLILAWVSFLLVLFVLFKGDEILQYVAIVYPDWAFPAFFIPWFLLLISSVQKLPENKPDLRLQIWVLKTTLPIFVFITPFFNLLLTRSTENTGALIGFEAYCIYGAILVLFLMHFLPIINAKQKLPIKPKS